MSVALAFSATVLFAGPADTPPRVVTTQVADTTVAEIFARARTLMRRGEVAAGWASYLEGASRARTPADWELFGRDMAWIANPGELTAWREAAPAARPALVKLFWAERDLRDGTPAGGRLAVHVARLDEAMHRYPQHHGRGGVQVMRVSASSVGYGLASLRDYVPTQDELDDRAVIFIRQGEPAVRTLSARHGLESWTYERDDQAVTVHFMETLFDGSSGNGTLVASPPLETFTALCDVDPAYCRVASRPGPVPPEQLEQVRQHALAAITRLTTTDSAPRPGE
jgi:hypothetical protein